MVGRMMGAQKPLVVLPMGPPMPDWYERSACRGTPLPLFFEPANELAAKALCVGCPVRTECFEYAMRNCLDFGVWGGLTSEERLRLRGRTPRRRGY